MLKINKLCDYHSLTKVINREWFAIFRSKYKNLIGSTMLYTRNCFNIKMFDQKNREIYT